MGRKGGEFSAIPVGWDGRRWPHRIALATACATFLLILAGGLVTNTGAGLAVPDWPTTFGHNMFLFPWSGMVGGIFYEHSHRLLGSAVGILTLALGAALWRWEPRRWVRRLGAAAVAAVLLQGILGGLRVVLVQDSLAIVHGMLAQGFFALVAGMALFTSEAWIRMPERPLPGDDGRVGALSLFIAVLVYVQIFFGALLTHLGARLDAHLATAGALSLLVPLLAARVWRRRAVVPHLVRPAILLCGLLAFQLLLGLGAYLGRFTGFPLPLGQFSVLALPVAHRLNAGLLLVTGALLASVALRTAGWPRGRTGLVGAEKPSLAQAAQKGSDARRRAQRRLRRTPGTPQGVRERANAAGGPFSAACRTGCPRG
ncbi:MAG TPA: COX15/CtaA family protein [Candidatus Methylomirabilis sp.]|jgi:cytochrome c oxidase assembly protein subunit 15